ncbi:MAG: ATP-binding protein [Gammaproteobacteria bacterium]|jgi:predicted AAA+ superfamily ATPase
MPDLDTLLERVEGLLERLEGVLPNPTGEVDWSHHAFRWRGARVGGRLQPIRQPHRVTADDLLCMERQKAEILRNTAQFVAGRPANNVLLWGSRGTGKSTLIKAAFNAFRDQGLRLIEVDKNHLVELPDIVDCLFERPERFMVFCDDLSFEADDAGYKSLKAVLEGSAAAPPENVLVYATSNRRHLMPEYQRENQEARMVNGELHQGETVEEKVSLSERFGLWLSFYPFDQEQYLEICNHWLRKLGTADTADAAVREAALQWARYRGSRSGRVARQFALDRAGRTAG